MFGPPEQVSPDLWGALQAAQEVAHRLGVQYVGPEHLLLGLTRNREVAGARVLMALVDLERVQRAVEYIVRQHPPGGAVTPGAAMLTPRAQRVLSLAGDEARRLGHQPLGSDHLLLGLIREGEGIPAGVLASLGVQDLEGVRDQVSALRNPPPV